jgi:hypothetical protein
MYHDSKPRKKVLHKWNRPFFECLEGKEIIIVNSKTLQIVDIGDDLPLEAQYG